MTNFAQENRLGTPEELDQKRRNASKQLTQAEDTLRSTKEELHQINERIHYTGQFLATTDTFWHSGRCCMLITKENSAMSTL